MSADLSFQPPISVAPSIGFQAPVGLAPSVAMQAPRRMISAGGGLAASSRMSGGTVTSQIDRTLSTPARTIEDEKRWGEYYYGPDLFLKRLGSSLSLLRQTLSAGRRF